MASAKSIALRQEAAFLRIEDALKQMHVRVGDGLRSPVADPEVRMANQLEVIAGALERAAGKQEKAVEQIVTEPDGVVVAVVETVERAAGKQEKAVEQIVTEPDGVVVAVVETVEQTEAPEQTEPVEPPPAEPTRDEVAAAEPVEPVKSKKGSK